MCNAFLSPFLCYHEVVVITHAHPVLSPSLVRYGDRQMMARGMLMMVVMISLSNAKPLKSLSPVRPLPSILHPALVASMTLQFIVHLICMRFVTTMVKAHPAYVPTVEVDYLALAQEQTVYSDVKVKFAPSLFNTVSVCEKEGCGAYLRTVFFPSLSLSLSHHTHTHCMHSLSLSQHTHTHTCRPSFSSQRRSK